MVKKRTFIGENTGNMRLIYSGVGENMVPEKRGRKYIAETKKKHYPIEVFSLTEIDDAEREMPKLSAWLLIDGTYDEIVNVTNSVTVPKRIKKETMWVLNDLIENKKIIPYEDGTYCAVIRADTRIRSNDCTEFLFENICFTFYYDEYKLHEVDEIDPDFLGTFVMDMYSLGQKPTIIL